jgi:diguanylate cyclase (GGDEF)-like protein
MRVDPRVELEGRVDSSGGGSVLVIDGDEEARTAIEHVLRSLALRTVKATTGEQGLRRAAANPEGFDAAIVEVRLEGAITSGFEVARRLKSVGPATASIPVLFVTRQEILEEEVVRAADHGAMDILRKPLSLAILAAKVRAAVERAGVLRQLRLDVTIAERHALVDPLTRLSNRRHLETRVLEESAYSKRHREAFAVVMLDLDHFKSVNDTHGHEEGDRVLAEFASALRSVLRYEDVSFRYGGEEFVLLLRACEAPRAVEVALRVRAYLHQNPHRFPDGASRPITFSGGAAAGLASEGFAGDDLIARADEALYDAKRGGRDRIEIWQRATSAKQLRVVPVVPAEAVEAESRARALMRALREARVLISAEERWIPQGYAQDAEGRWRPVGSDDAVRFSVLGAVVRVSAGSRDITSASRRALREGAPDLYRKLSSTRAELTHAEALTLLDRSIAYLQARSATPSPFAVAKRG